MRCEGRALAALALAIGLAPGAGAEELPAYSLRELLERSRRASPEVRAARARSAEARAAARRGGADREPDVGLNVVGTWTDRAFPSFFNVPPRQAQGDGTLRQRLWDAGARRARHHSLREQARAASAEAAGREQSILARVAQAYLDVLEEQERQLVLAESLATRERRLRDVRARVEAGVLLETGALQGELDVIQDRRALAVSRTATREARERLRILAGLAPGEELRLSAALDPLPALDPDAVSLGARAADAPETRRREALARAAAREARARAGETGPWVDVEARALHIFSGLGFASSDDSWGEFEGWVGWTALDGGREQAELWSARHAARAARAEADAARAATRLELDDLRRELSDAGARLRTSLVQVDLARRDREIEERRYLEGVSVRADLLDAEVAFRRARLAEVESRFAMLSSMVRLLEVSGGLEQAALPGTE